MPVNQMMKIENRELLDDELLDYILKPEKPDRFFQAIHIQQGLGLPLDIPGSG
jgi:hypothetical protein